MTANLAEALVNTAPAPCKPSDPIVEHLDYGYISACKDGKELEKILKMLRSGKEGRWPDLENHCEAKLAEVHPKSRLLRISNQLLTAGALDSETREEIDMDMGAWLSSVNDQDTKLKNSKNLMSDPVPSVRQSNKVDYNSPGSDTPSTPKNDNPERIGAYDYRAWDKFDPATECDRVDKEAERPKPGPKVVPKTGINTQVLTDAASKQAAAEREKEKGNEAFKCGDYEESINYYTNSIQIYPLTATYNNRGLAQIRLERYFKGIEDFNKVLEVEPDNIKALLRRADGHEKVGNITEANRDLERSVIVDENNSRAKQLRDEFKKRHKKLLTKGGKRMKIVESSDEEEEVATPLPATRVATPPPAASTPPEPTKHVTCTRDPSPPPEKQIVEVLPLTDEVARLKQEASALFASGTYGEGVAKYTACLDKLDKTLPGNWYHQALLLSNRAACKSKIGQCTECIKDCNASLELNPRFFKSVLRRAIAFENIENIKKAYEDYRLTVVLDPSQIAAHQGVSRMGVILRERYGVKWRKQVSDHAIRPTGPEFVDKSGKYIKPVQQPTPKPEPPQTKQQETVSPKATDMPSEPKPKNEIPKPQKEVVAPQKSAPKSDDAKTALKLGKMPTKEEQYVKFKDQGNSYVAKQLFRDALRCYEKCITLNNELIPAHLNSALCHLKLGSFSKAVQCADMVLAKEPNNIKALYRRASANKQLNQFPAAAKDLKFLVEKDPENKTAKQLLEQVKREWNEQLRGIQTKSGNTKKGKKIPIVATDSESDSDEPAPQQPPKQKPQQSHKQTSEPKVPNPNKPWLKKSSDTNNVSGLFEPPTAFSFLQHWSSYKKRKDIEQFGKVLEACDPSSFPKIFSSSLDADMVIAIVDAVDKYFIPNKLHEKALEILKAITTVQRFEVMTMLMTVQDKATISKVIDRLEGDKVVIQTLHKRFV